MSFETGMNHEMSRRSFLIGGGAVLFGGAVLLGDETGMNINGPAGGQLQPAKRLETPASAPLLFKPWVTGETIYEAPNELNWVAFRADDGPWPVTSHQTQEIFNTYGIGHLINPTLIARNVELNPDAALEYVANGNQIINHSYSHQYTDAINASEIEHADNVIEAITKQRPELYAVPGLGEGPKITAEATRLNKPIISTRVFIGDTDSPTKDAATLIARAKAQIKSGSIIVFHPETSSHGPTRQALPAIIEHVLANFVPVQMKDLLFTRYNPDGTRKNNVPIIRKENIDFGSSDRLATLATFCCGYIS